MSYVSVRQDTPNYGSFGLFEGTQKSSPENKYQSMSNKDLAKDFGNNFDYFQNPKKNGTDAALFERLGKNYESMFDMKNAPVTQEHIRHVANRPLSGSFVDDNMTLLAREVLNRPGLNRHLDFHDEKNSELHDGIIERDDVNRTIEHYKGERSDTHLSGQAGQQVYSGSSLQKKLANAGTAASAFINGLDSGYDTRISPLRSGYVGVPNSSVARDFLDNFTYFQDPQGGFVTRGALEHFASRPMIEEPYHDRMTQLGMAILGRPELSRLFDAINPFGREDGYISYADAHRVVDFYESQDSQVERMPMRFNGHMQRQRIEGGFENAVLAQEFKGAKNSDLALELGNNFDYFQPNANNKITQATLRDIAGRPMSGDPIDDRMTLLAKEIISRPQFNRDLDSVEDSDKPDTIIGRDTVETLSRRGS